MKKNILFILSIVLILFSIGCSDSRVHLSDEELMRLPELKSTQTPLGDTPYVASAGATYYKGESRPRSYSINISKYNKADKASYSFYRKEFKMDEIPSKYINLNVTEFVEYQQKDRKVIFTIGEIEYDFVLPDDDASDFVLNLDLIDLKSK